MKYRIHRYPYTTIFSAREQRMAYIQELLIRVNQLMVTTTELSTLFQNVCDLIVEFGRFQIASIAIPKDDGSVWYFGMAGAKDYLKQVFVSVDPDIPEGKGPLGTAWREDRAIYNPSFHDFKNMTPWVEHADLFGLQSSASIPIHRRGKKWGILTIYHGDAYIFDEAMKALVETLALDISNGIDRIDLEEIHRHYTEHTSLGMAIMMQDRIISVNQRLVKMLGYLNDKELIGHSIRILFPVDSEQDPLVYWHDALQRLDEVQPLGFAMMQKDGQRIWVEVSISVLREQFYGSDDISIWTIQEVTDRYRLQQKLEHAAMYDPLTELPNRRALENYMEEVLQHASHWGFSVIVGLIDLDNFKWINDTYGHEVGDRVLKEFTCRLQAFLGAVDFLARWGGDEFVVVFQHEGKTPPQDAMAKRLEALHQAIDYPIEVAPGKVVTIQMSMGLSVYPQHGEDSDHLVRLADIAMYQVKNAKWTRNQWWQWGIEEMAVETPVPNFRFPISDMVDIFFESMKEDPDASAIFLSLHPLELQLVTEHAKQHLDFLLHDRSSDEFIHKRAKQLGEIHALVGVNGKLISLGMEFFSKMVADIVNEQPISIRNTVYPLLQHRLQHDLHVQLQALEQTMLTYLEVLYRPLSSENWQADLEALSQLPGINGVLFVRMHSQEGFVVEQALGSKGKQIAEVMMTSATKAVPVLVGQQGQSLIAESWLGASIQSTPAYLNDQRLQIRHEAFRQLGVRSTAAIPLLDEHRHTVAVIELNGAYPNQFESKWMQVFMQGLQRWGEERWVRQQESPTFESLEKMKLYRSLLFSGGFTLYMQPIVDMQTGHVMKFEGLARLKEGNGQLIQPGQFLPVMGETEKERLFQLAFEEAMIKVSKWGEKNDSTKISINLSPVTLMQSNLLTWIQSTLQRYLCMPESVIFELLETPGVELKDVEAPLKQLSEMGIQLAIDDFGSGDSNFLRLAAFPIQMVKLDRGLLAPILDKPQSVLSLLGSLIQIGHDFGWEIVVEGLETFEVVEAMFMLGARYGQGFYFAKPLPMEQVKEWKRTFSFSLSGDEIHSTLGALAYLIKSRRNTRNFMPSEEDCPITKFFLRRGWNDSDGMSLHHQIHEGVNDHETFKQLLDWVEDQIKIENQLLAGMG